MRKPAAKFAAAALVSLLAGISFATASRGETVEDDRCLSGPRGETPAGYHWYYRFDRSERRNCWYLRQQGANVSQAAPQNIVPPTARPPSQAPVRAQPSVVDAHAEVRARSNQDYTGSVPVTAAAPKENPLAGSSAENATPAVITSRWPELSAASPPWPSQPTASRSATTPPPDSSRLPQADATPEPLVAAASAVPGQPGTIMGLLATTICMLALAGLTAMLISGRGRARRLRRGDLRSSPGPLSETTDDNRIVLSAYPAPSAGDYRPRFARKSAEGRTAIDRVAKRHSRISRGRATKAR
jgi:hypothetical protein